MKTKYLKRHLQENACETFIFGIYHVRAIHFSISTPIKSKSHKHTLDFQPNNLLLIFQFERKAKFTEKRAIC